MDEYKELVRKVDKHENDLYYGDGRDNPSVTTRLALIERGDELTSEKFERYDSLLNKALWLSVSAVAGVFGFLIKVIFFPHMQ